MNNLERTKIINSAAYAPSTRWRHYKGATCRIIARAVDEATGNILIIYEYELPHTNHCWARTFENFTSLIGGKPRFEAIEEGVPKNAGSPPQPKEWEARSS